MGSQPACWLEVLLHARRVVEESILGGRSAAGKLLWGSWQAYLSGRQRSSSSFEAATARTRA